MTIELITHDKKRFLPLLLLADEQESMIDRYLERGDLYVMHDDDGTPVAVAVVTLEGEGVCELKNLAVKPEAQRQGIGSRLLGYLCRRYAKSCHTLLVGTGDTPQTTSFYRQNGFTYSHAVPDFFTANYDHPIIENGILLRDMLYFHKSLAPVKAIIRDYRQADKPALMELIRLNIPDYFAPEEAQDFSEYLDNKRELYYVALADQKIVGCGGINLSEDKTTAKISWDILHPEYQGQGIGTQLLKHRIKQMEAFPGIREITVRTSQMAYRFYEKQGFVLKATEKDYWAKGYDLYAMEYAGNAGHPTVQKHALRPAMPEDLPAICALFRDTILTVNLQDYTPEEVADWASCGDDIARWHTLFSTLHFLVAMDSAGNLTGYASLRDDGYLHSLFVHKDHQGEGIASALLSAMEDYARRHGIPEITSEVSLTARPFFERRGYQVVKAQKARARRLYLTNFVMSKSLHP